MLKGRLPSAQWHKVDDLRIRQSWAALYQRLIGVYTNARRAQLSIVYLEALLRQLNRQATGPSQPLDLSLLTMSSTTQFAKEAWDNVCQSMRWSSHHCSRAQGYLSRALTFVAQPLVKLIHPAMRRSCTAQPECFVNSEFTLHSAIPLSLRRKQSIRGSAYRILLIIARKMLAEKSVGKKHLQASLAMIYRVLWGPGAKLSANANFDDTWVRLRNLSYEDLLEEHSRAYPQCRLNGLTSFKRHVLLLLWLHSRVLIGNHEAASLQAREEPTTLLMSNCIGNSGNKCTPRLH